MRKLQIISCILSVGMVGAASAAVGATLARDIAGAWALNDGDCATIFEKKGGVPRFSRQSEMFPSSILINRGRIMSPGRTCLVGSATTSGDVISLRLNCRTPVSYQNVAVRLKILSPEEIEYQFPDAPQLNQRYRRCAL